MYNTIHVDKCSCGAYTVHYDNDTNASMPEDIYIEHSGNRKPDNNVYMCNYCVNKWGVDLCGCGSGEIVGKCEGTHYECVNHIPAQEIGIKKQTQLWKS